MSYEPKTDKMPRAKLPRKKGTSVMTSKVKVRIQDETSRALDLRRMGRTLREIAKELGCSPAKIHGLLEKGIKDIPTSSRDAYVTSIVEREEGVIEAHWANRADPDSAKVILASHRNLVDLLGLAAPKQSIVATTDVTGSTPAEAQRIMRELFGNAVEPAPAETH